MREISVTGFISMSDNEPGVVLQFADNTTGTTIMLDVTEAEALLIAMPKAIRNAWDLVAAEAAKPVDDACPILPPDADEGKCSCNLTPEELDAILNEKGGLGSPPPEKALPEAQAEQIRGLIRNDGVDSEDGRSC